MRQNFILSILIISFSLLNSCNCNKNNFNPLSDGQWVNLGQQILNITPNTTASLVIDSNAYILYEYDSAGKNITEMFSYNPTAVASWSQLQSFPGAARKFPVTFTIGNIGYYGGGYDGTKALSDYWQYDPTQEIWTRIADLPASPRYSAVAFGIGNYGYLGTGTDGTNFFKDFWRYDPNTNSWTSIGDYPGQPKYGAVSFVYKNMGFVVTGITSGATLDNFFYSFDPSKPGSSGWYQLRPIFNFSPLPYDDSYTTIARTNAVGFVILNTLSDGGGDRAYITTGTSGGGVNNTTWAYNFADSLWNQKSSFVYPTNSGAVGFSVQNLGFVGIGFNGNANYSNLNQWFPDLKTN